MPLSALDQAIYAIDRRVEIKVRIRGELLASGLSENEVPDIPNLLGADIEYDMEQLPPTAVLRVANLSRHYVKIDRGDSVEIDAGFDGNFERVFTGTVKRRRPAVAHDTIECVGKTGVLTRPFRVSSEGDPAKSWTSTLAVTAIEDILDDLTPPLALYDIDPIYMADGVTDWSIGTVVPARMDAMPPSDMIRKIADVYGYRVYEQKSGTLRIRKLLEAPAPTAYRVYGTQGTDQIGNTTLSFDESNIDSNLALGNIAANTRRSQGFTPVVSGNAVRATLWLRKIGAPGDKLVFHIESDDGSGEPSGVVLGGGDPVAGSLLVVGSYTQVDVTIHAETQLVGGDLYHIVARRGGAVDAVNYYEIGADAGAGYAAGIANVYDGATWAAGGGDLAFEVEHSALPTLRLLDIAGDEDEDQVKKQVVVRGASVAGVTLPSGDDPGGDATQTQITAERHTDRDDVVAGDYHLYSMLYANDLVETAQVADEVAARLVDKHHRVLESIEIEVPFDPRINLGATIEIQDQGTSPSYAGEVTGLGGNWWIRGYRHSLSADAAVTQVSLFGGDQSGTSSEANPEVEFSWTTERELVGNAIQAVITFHDQSSDNDGWLVNYRWVDTYSGGATDETGEALREITIPYDPSVDASFTMTLTVTDNDGNTASITHTIDVSTDNAEVYAPVVACAGGNTCMATFDGGLSWEDIATPSGVAKECAITFANDPDDPPLVFFGTDNGRIYRSSDRMQTLSLVYTDVDGDLITSIVPDIDRRLVLWATTTDRVLVSLDFGATWTVYADFTDSDNWPRTTTTTVVAPVAIQSSVILGNDDTRLQWATPMTTQPFGLLGSASFWLRRVGSPADSVRLFLYTNASGEPDELLATSDWIMGSSISNAALVQITFNLNARVQNSTTYHLVIERSGLPDAVNHYLVATNLIGASDQLGFPGTHDFDLDANIDASQLTLDVVAGQGASADAPPFLVKIDAEIMRVTAINVDTFTVVRARLGTAGAAHLAAADIYTLDWTAVGDAIVFDARIVSSEGHIDPTPPDPRPVNGILVSHPDNQRVWIFGGHGDAVESWFATNFIPHGGSRWFSEIAQGDGVGANVRDANDTVVDAVVSHATAHDLGLIFERTGGGVPDNPYIYTEQFFPVGEAAWRNGAASFVLPGVDGVSVTGNNNQLREFGAVLDNKTFYVANDGRSWWAIPDVLPGTGANRPHDLLQVSAWKDIYLAAMDEGIAKSVDGGLTWGFFRGAGGGLIVAWPGGAIGWDVAIEYRQPRRFDLAVLVRDAGAETAMATRQGHGAWIDRGPLPSGYETNPHRLWHFSQIDSQTFFYVRYTSALQQHSENLYRTPDTGAAWTNVLSRCGTIARGPDGRLWASRTDLPAGLQPRNIWYSDDDGLTWTIAHTDSRAPFGQPALFFSIAVDPNNHKRVMAVGHLTTAPNIAVLVSEDAHLGAGATWSEVTPTVLTNFEGIAAKYHQPTLLAGENGRWLLGKQLAAVNTREIWKSDNNGASWELAYTINMAATTYGFTDAFRMGNILFFGGGLINSGVPGRGLISFNNGDNWEELTVATGGSGQGGFAYDPRFDMLFVNELSGNNYEFMQPPREGQSWVEGPGIGLDAAMGYAANPLVNGIAVQGTT